MIKLVVDNAEPGIPDYGNIPEMLRQYAGEIEKGQYGELVSVVLILEGTPRLKILGCGEEPTAYEMMGMFEAAKLEAFADHMNGDAK